MESNAETPPAPLAPGLDHVIVMARDQLDAAVAAYEAMGFAMTPRGHHSMGTSNNLAIFANNYLELLGFEKGREHLRPEVADAPPGLHGVALRCDDLDATVARVRSGWGKAEPKSFTRPVSTGAGEFEAAFTVVPLPEIRFEGGRSFFCFHRTPQFVWREEWRSHANGAEDITEFVVVSDDPRAALAQFEPLYGPDLVSPVAGGFAFQAAEAQVLALTAEAARARFGDAVPTAAPGQARMIALSIRTSSLRKAGGALSASGLAFEDLGGRLRVGPEVARGLVIDFHE